MIKACSPLKHEDPKPQTFKLSVVTTSKADNGLVGVLEKFWVSFTSAVPPSLPKPIAHLDGQTPVF